MPTMQHVAKFLDDLEPDSSVIWRGHANREWALKPSIGRHYNDDWTDAVQYEMSSLGEFKRKSIPYLKHTPQSEIEWLCLMQHHGCSTRLLDFTTNPLIALYFASDPITNSDGEVIAARYLRQYDPVTHRDLFSVEESFAYHPPYITERVIGQSGCFVCSWVPNRPLSEDQISRIHIPMKEKANVRRELREIGITFSSLFPGMDGLCRDINDELIINLQFHELLF